MNVKKLLRGPLLYIILAIIAVWVGSSLITMSGFREIPTQQGLQFLKDGKVSEAKIVDGDQRVDLTLTRADKDLGNQVQFYYVAPRGAEVVDAVTSANLKDGFTDEVPQSSWFLSLLSILLPLLLIGVFFWLMLSGMQGGGNKVMQFGKSKAKLVSKESPQVTFADVAGADEAIEELEEIKDFLKEPAKFQAVGARIPKGVLLYGPPGTGKTLLARAVAGEAGVPFYSISGSDFVEMFVGVGASRVRDLFQQAKENAPAIIFIDEIDAVGRHRGAGMGGGHDEREQTLNQLLVEMDGFDVKANVILIAATNRPDILDPALLRPGRFDRQIGVDAPDMLGRKRILEVHAKGKPMAKGVDLEVLARKTPGFTGADLANVLNEAALLTARSNAQLIDNRALDEAVDRVMAGPQRRTRIMRDKEKLITAYHEGGHALVATAMNNTDPVTKITILPRGRALGYTMVMPLEDRYSVSRNELLDQLAYAMGGRVAEEMIFHDPTTGASNDIEKATATARKMVTEFGMSAAVGPLKLGQSSGEVFLGRDMGHQRDYSERMAESVDKEVRELLEAAHDEAYEVLGRNRPILDKLAAALLEHETLSQAELAPIFADVEKLPPRTQWLSSTNRPVSDLPPIEMPLPKAPIDEGVVDGGVSSGDTAPSKPKRARPPAPRVPPPRRRRVAVDRTRIEAAVVELLAAIGEDVSRPGLAATPRRVAESYSEYFAGLGVDPLDHLRDAIPVGPATGELVLVRDLAFRSVCEHHLLPFIGRAHLAYLPGDRVVGLGRLPAVVDTLAARPQVQERLTEEIAEALQAGLAPRGILVVLDAVHGCVTTRGPRQVASSTVTMTSRGELSNPAQRAEIMALIGSGLIGAGQ